MRPSTIAALTVVFVVVWTLYFSISEIGGSVHHDMAEAYAWGREFQLGYYKHPPFWAWLCGAWFAVLPRAGWTFAILTSLNAAVGLIGSWKLIGCFASGDKRVAATMLLLLTPFYTFLAYKYNANSIFLSIWPWTMFAFVRAIDRGKLTDAVLFGAFAGLGVLSKYYVAILGVTCLLAAIQHPARKRYFTSASPYLSAVVAAALSAPHLWWLVANDAPTVRYFADETGRVGPFVAVHAVLAFFGALAQNAVAIAVAAFIGRSALPQSLPKLRARWAEPRFRMLATLAFAPLILTTIAALAFHNKISTNMMIGEFSLAPLLAIEIVGDADFARLRKVAARLAGAVMIGALVASPAVAIAKVWFSRAPSDVEPRKELADAATEFWREKTGKPLVYVGGSFVYENAVVFYSQDRPHAFIGLDFRRSPWVTPQKLKQDGLLTVCLKEDSKCRDATLGLITPRASQIELTLAHRFFGHVADPATFVLTAIAPSGG